MESVNIGIFGPKLSGKTTLAISLSKRFWRMRKRRSFVLDPNLDPNWGEQAWVTDDEPKFWAAVWKTQDALVIVDEASETINRDKGLIAVFTRLRHLHHVLLVIGHSGINLLPIMREQIDTLYLFHTSAKAASLWADDMAQPGFREAVQLRQFEFLYGTLWQPPVVMRLELRRGEK
jgi:molybdopterin-guanine dinucleotide biosynthesis protein